MLREQVAALVAPGAWRERERLLERKAEWESRAATSFDFVTLYQIQSDEVVADSLSAADAIIPIVLEAAARVAEGIVGDRDDTPERIRIATAIREMGGERG